MTVMSNFLVSTPASAETLQVSIPTIVSENLPETTGRIVRALHNTGLDIRISYLPNKRSLSMLTDGKVALEFFRTPSVATLYPDLVQLQPRMQSLKYKMITSMLTPEKCEVSERDYKGMSVAGVLGIGLYQVHYYPKFRNFTVLKDVQTAASFVALGRADVSFMADQMLATIPEDVMPELIVCDTNRRQFDFYPYLHKDFLWVRKPVESALRSEFSAQQPD